MRSLYPLLVASLLLDAGCSRSEPARDSTADDPAGNEERAAANDEFTHSVAEETAYYTDGPQQGRPPDGLLKVGTKIKLIRESGSYSLVRTEDGVEAYVTADSLEELAE